MRTRLWLPVLVLAVIALLAAAVSAGHTQRKGGTLRIASAHDVDSLDPAIAYGTDSWAIEFTTCAKLYSYPDRPGSEGTVLIPEVAAGLPRFSADRKTQTIELKRTYRFDTGAPIRAANFVAALNRDLVPELASGATNYMHEIVGVDAVIAGKAQRISGVRALGPYTLRITTTMPLADLVSRLTMPFFCPIAVDSPSDEIRKPLGSGPYHVVSHVENRQIVLERNRFYRGPRPANVDRIVWTFMAPGACKDALDGNQLDYCLFIPPSGNRELAQRYGINRPNGRFFVTPTLAIYFFDFNHDRPAFKGAGQIPLKQAINLVLDRHALAAAVSYLGARRTDQILPSTLGRDEHIYPLRGVSDRDLAKARALVSKAKFKPEKLVLYAHVPGFKGVNAAWAQIFRFDVARLGIDVEIRYFGSFVEVLRRAGTRGEPVDVIIDGWTPDYPDGFGYFGPLLDGSHIAQSGNFDLSYFDRPKVNREIEHIEGLTGAARRQAWADLDVQVMRTDPPFAVFLGGTEVDYLSKSYGCYVYQAAISFPDFGAACKK